jgi:CheY-like chemotaxis protein/anti-sigma regulatory factor (Ser/Thr protein kinase)
MRGAGGTAVALFRGGGEAMAHIEPAEAGSALERIAAQDALLHELCNRVAPLLALTERLRELPLAEEHRPLLAALYRSSRDVERLLRSLRDPAEFFVPRPAEFDLGALCAELCDAARADLRATGARILLDLGQPTRVFADEVQVAEVIVNLLRNAVEAAGRGGRVVVAVTSRGRVARVAIRDNGPGIDPRVRETLFEPGVSTKGPSGRGIGLALSRALARAQPGRLVHRRLPGATEFILFLRRARPAPAPAHHARVLVVEDDPDVRLALCAVLDDEFEVTAVADGDEALAALAAEPFDALLTDQHFSRGPLGTTLVSRAMQLQPSLRGRIVLITGDPRAARPVSSLVRLVRKPFDGASVRRALHESLCGTARSAKEVVG